MGASDYLLEMGRKKEQEWMSIRHATIIANNFHPPVMCTRRALIYNTAFLFQAFCGKKGSLDGKMGRLDF